MTLETEGMQRAAKNLLLERLQEMGILNVHGNHAELVDCCTRLWKKGVS